MGYYVLGPTVVAATTCESLGFLNCDIIAHIKLIFDTVIDDPEWKNPVDVDENRKIKMAADGHFVKI